MQMHIEFFVIVKIQVLHDCIIIYNFTEIKLGHAQAELVKVNLL